MRIQPAIAVLLVGASAWGPKTHTNTKFKAVCGVAATVGALQCAAMLPAFAIDEGAAPKMAFFNSKDGSQEAIGDMVYDASSRQALREKVSKLSQTFDGMVSKFELYMKDESRQDAQAALSLGMGALKGDMRTVTKAACGGDILIRADSVGITGNKEPAFDFTTGQFALKPAAADAEAVVSLVNDLYFNTVPKGSIEDALREEREMVADFKDWLALVSDLLK